MRARHGLVSGLLGRRTRSFGRGGRRGAESLVLPFGGIFGGARLRSGVGGGGFRGHDGPVVFDIEVLT